MNGFQKFWGHLSTITRHRHRVIAHCARAGILWQGLRHDLSKYSPTEFWQGVKFFDGTHSPTEDERRTLGYSLAWMHHKGRNRHHWEYWTDYSVEEKRYVPVPMPRRYMAEMICDRIAAKPAGIFAARQNARPYAPGNPRAADAVHDPAARRGGRRDVCLAQKMGSGEGINGASLFFID